MVKKHMKAFCCYIIIKLADLMDDWKGIDTLVHSEILCSFALYHSVIKYLSLQLSGSLGDIQRKHAAGKITDEECQVISTFYQMYIVSSTQTQDFQYPYC